ncbi:LCP family protein [Streptomyces sp. Je 1-79]|uniref:LCP family protein n=1 Tax=Streptomyces sp. Je 1-79 TaxID=2943847 RepID=UPI0021A3DCE8|nr:LCP family protein [Streptomyces sp. Je 1-79]MCT4355610.1 LCP family protein [Streptomyces sp. Je 1-79]
MTVRKFSRPSLLVLASAALVALGSGTIAGAGAPALPSPRHGLNILVAGVDSRQGLTAAELNRYYAGGKGCDCTDVMMLVHISAANDRVSVVSLPRDSLTEFPGDHVDRRTGKVHGRHPAKINAAHTEGGPAFTVEAVERMTGTPVHRYLEIDFRRFIDGVDRVEGGVPICTETQLKDPVTGIDLAPGTRHVKGGEALQYVRSRRADGKMDFGRIQKQQRFVVNTLKTIRADLTAPTRLRLLASTLRGTAHVERSLTVTEMLILGARLRDLTPERTEFAMVPIRRFNPLIAGVGSSVAVDEEQAAEVFEALRSDRPLPAARPGPTSEIPRGLGEYRPAAGDSLVCP